MVLRRSTHSLANRRRCSAESMGQILLFGRGKQDHNTLLGTIDNRVSPDCQLFPAAYCGLAFHVRRGGSGPCFPLNTFDGSPRNACSCAKPSEMSSISRKWIIGS